MKLRNVILKTENIVLQQVRKSSNKTCIIMGSGYSLSVDQNDKIVNKDPLFFPPNGKKYGDYTVLSLFYTFECEGLSVAGKELANYIDNHMQEYETIILHGHSKCGSCFIDLMKWLERKVIVVSVSAPLNQLGTPIANREVFDKRLNCIQKVFFHKIFSDHNVDKDLCENSEFLTQLSMKYLKQHQYVIVVSICGGFSINPIQLLLTWINKAKGIDGDGIIPRSSQIPKDIGYHQITSTHAGSMSKSIQFVKNFL